MNGKWYKEKNLFYIAGASLAILMLGLLLIYSNSLFNLQETYARHYLFFKYCPKFVSERFWRLSRKQSNTRWRNYRNNVHMKEFFKLYPDSRFSVSSMPDDSDENTVFLRKEDDCLLKLTMKGEKTTFGLEKWNQLKTAGGDLRVLFPELKSELPLKTEYDYARMTTSAKKGNDEAMQWLAFVYLRGIGVPRDYSKAFTWCEKLAKKRLGGRYVSDKTAWAMKCLGIMYLNGFGVENNPVTAYKWLLESAQYGNVSAYAKFGSFDGLRS
ncbi:MAG: sel1 repeat family protein [Kiritimatiellaeota bacterium]|nr:sel1 repeat family protein [Kiritimatiellota bacterium]